MANELTYTGGDIKVAAVLSRFIHQNLADNTDLRSLCTYAGDVTGSGSQVLTVAAVTLDDAMAAANVDETTDLSNTALTDNSINITVARQAIKRVVSDLWGLSQDSLRLEDLAADIAGSAARRFSDMLAALFASLSTSAGTSGTTLSYDNIVDARNKLRLAGAPGEVACVLHPKQFGEFVASLGAETGSPIFSPETENIQGNAAGFGYQGKWRDIHFWTSDSVASDGTDYHGAMFVEGAFAYAEGRPRSPYGDVVTVPDSAIMIEFDRDAGPAHTVIVGNYYVGVSEMEDARGVNIVSVD